MPTLKAHYRKVKSAAEDMAVNLGNTIDRPDDPDYGPLLERQEALRLSAMLLRLSAKLIEGIPDRDFDLEEERERIETIAGRIRPR